MNRYNDFKFLNKNGHMRSRKVIVIFFLPTEAESACVITREKWYEILFNECKIFHLHLCACE